MEALQWHFLYGSIVKGESLVLQRKRNWQVEGTASSVFPCVTGSTAVILVLVTLRSPGWSYKLLVFSSSCPFSGFVNHVPVYWLSSTCCRCHWSNSQRGETAMKFSQIWRKALHGRQYQRCKDKCKKVASLQEKSVWGGRDMKVFKFSWVDSTGLHTFIHIFCVGK